MNNRVIWATLAGGVASYLLGWLIYGIILHDMSNMYGSATGVQRTDMSAMWALILGNFVLAYFLAHVFSRWAGVNTLQGGLQTGALLGFLIWLGVDLIMFGTTNIYSTTGLVVDVVTSAIMGAVTGAVVGWVLGYKRAG